SRGLTYRALSQEPLSVFRCWPAVFECPDALAVVLSVLRSLLASS
ncbi:unnamed protein product, partial [Phaeothamnion confervicola]